ncbi:hypothetical protein [Paraburkholderia atlantica]|uniref:hypothetical protein n=1 Tax=Paraburkholderia atlantica TaxID=2654982 RepID=UPI003D1A5BF5
MNAEAIEDRLRDWCSKNGHAVTPLNEVSEPVAALLLGLSTSALRLQFNEGRSLVPVARYVLNRRMYAIADIACYLAHGAQRALD